MEIVSALEKLGFSFWQILIVGFAIALRYEIRELLARLASVKLGDKEVVFHEDKSIRDLKAVKDQLKEQPQNPEAAIGLIEKAIDSKLISALGEIKRETYRLWPAILSLKEQSDSKGEIREETFIKIKAYLQQLEEAGLLTYDIDYIGPPQYGLRVAHLKKLSNNLDSLIDAVDH